MKRESVIGLEIHLQLKTKTKLFCSCSSDYIGATPNTNVCPVCLAVPGTLPILNDHAVELGVKIGLGLHCSICDNTRFHRKQTSGIMRNPPRTLTFPFSILLSKSGSTNR